MKKQFLMGLGLLLLPLFAYSHAYNDSTVQKPIRDVTPPKGPLPNHNADFVLDAEFLYWYASVSNSSPIIVFDLINQGDEGTPQTVAVPKKIKEFNWDWDPGFRVGLGVITNHDGWDLYADWTYYYNSIHNSKSVPQFRTDLVDVEPPDIDLLGTKYLSSAWFAEGAEEKFQSIHAHWNLHFNEINLDLGRNYWISKTLTLRPHFGVRGHWSRTRVSIRGFYQNDEDLDNPQRIESDRIKQKYWGVGPTGGIDTAWHMTDNWSLFANGDLTLLYGRYSLYRKINMFLTGFDQQTNQTFVDTNFTQRVQHDGVYSTQVVFDFAFGFRYETTLANDGYRILFDLGWEHHFYPDFLKLEWNPGDDLDEANYFPTNGNLTLSGIVFRARFEF